MQKSPWVASRNGVGKRMSLHDHHDMIDPYIYYIEGKTTTLEINYIEIRST